MRTIPLLALGPLAALSMTVSLRAQPMGPGGPGGPGGDGEFSSWGLGLGVANIQKPYAGVDRETRPIPVIQFENRYVKVQGLGLEVKLPGLAIGDTQRLDVSLVGRRAMAGYEADDAPILAGMEERKGSFFVGAKAEWKTRLLSVGADWSADASGHSKGRKFSLGIGRPFRLGPVMLVPRIGATWQDRRYNDYYFGVRDAEARPDRPAYRPGGGVNYDIGLNGLVMVDRRHSVLLGVGANTLSAQIQDSPLVDRSSENRVFMMYVYRF